MNEAGIAASAIASVPMSRRDEADIQVVELDDDSAWNKAVNLGGVSDRSCLATRLQVRCASVGDRAGAAGGSSARSGYGPWRRSSSYRRAGTHSAGR